MYSALNTLSENAYFYISKDITLYTFLIVFKIVKSLQCILKPMGAVLCKGVMDLTYSA